MEKKLLLASMIVSISSLSPNSASAQLTPTEQRAAECLGYAIGALIRGETSNICDYNAEQSHQNEIDRNYIGQQELNDYIRKQDLKLRQIERRNEWLIHEDGVCLSCSNY